MRPQPPPRSRAAVVVGVVLPIVLAVLMAGLALFRWHEGAPTLVPPFLAAAVVCLYLGRWLDSRRRPPR